MPDCTSAIKKFSPSSAYWGFMSRSPVTSVFVGPKLRADNVVLGPGFDDVSIGTQWSFGMLVILRTAQRHQLDRVLPRSSVPGLRCHDQPDFHVERSSGQSGLPYARLMSTACQCDGGLIQTCGHSD